MRIRIQEYRVIGILQIALGFLLSVSLAFYFSSPKETLIPCAFFLTNIVSGLAVLAVGNDLVRDKVVKNEV